MKTSAREYIRKLLQRGRFTFTREQAETEIGSPRSTREALHRLEKNGWLFSPSQSFYVIIDPQHQGSGMLPVEWFIDDWAQHLGVQYYIGLLTAAMLHGAAHQKPQQDQVMMNRVYRTVRHDNHRIVFFYNKTIFDGAWEMRKSPAGYYRISTPEMTAYDILRYTKACPSLDLATTVLAELGEQIVPERLATLIEIGCETAVLQRLGYLLDQVGWRQKTSLLADTLQSQRYLWYRLRTDLPEEGERDNRWHIIVNTHVEADV